MGCLLHVRSWALLCNTLHTEALAHAVTPQHMSCILMEMRFREAKIAY